MSRLAVIWICCFLGLSINRSTSADEIVIDYSRPQPQNVGDFECSPLVESEYDFVTLNDTNLANVGTGLSECSIRAGELWKFLREQGVESTDRLVFFLDIDPGDSTRELSLESLEFSIRGDGDMEVAKMLLDRDGDNRILIPGYDLFRLRPQARMEVPLGFDFMSRFSAASTEMISFKSQIDGGTVSNPSIRIPGRKRGFGWVNYLMLTGFVVFWLVLFWILKRTTLPRQHLDSTDSHPINRSVPHTTAG